MSGGAAYNERMAHAVRPGIAPALLLSMPQLVDPNFHRTVVLLCEHNTDGAFGLVINRPTDTSASQAVRLLPPPSRDGGLALWAGGPVEPQRGWILMGSEPAESEALSRWVKEKLGPDVPLHFTAFHPDWKMLDKPPTPLEGRSMEPGTAAVRSPSDAPPDEAAGCRPAGAPSSVNSSSTLSPGSTCRVARPSVA